MTNPFVRKMESFRPLADDHLRKLESLSVWSRPFKSNAVVVRHDEKPFMANIVLSGWAYRYKLLPNGRRQITALFLPGDMCDPHACSFGATHQAVVTLTAATVMQVPNQVIRELAAGTPELAEVFWLQALLAIDVQREWMVSLGRRSAVERLAHLFCEISARLAIVGLSDGSGCECPLIQTDTADILGLSTVHVNRSLQQLKIDALVETHSKRLSILDRPKLEALAMFDPAYLHRPHEMTRRPETEHGTRPLP